MPKLLSVGMASLSDIQTSIVYFTSIEIYLGTKQHDGSTVSIQENARRKHMAIFGKSGVGKTTLMRNMIVADLNAGNGVTVIDPAGSLIEDLLDIVPRHRTNDREKTAWYRPFIGGSCHDRN